MLKNCKLILCENEGNLLQDEFHEGASKESHYCQDSCWMSCCYAYWHFSNSEKCLPNQDLFTNKCHEAILLVEFVVSTKARVLIGSKGLVCAYPGGSAPAADVETMFLTISAWLSSWLSSDLKWTWPRIFGGRGLGEDGVDNVMDLRSSDNISKLCDLRPESTMDELTVMSGLFFDSTSNPLRPLSDPSLWWRWSASRRLTCQSMAWLTCHVHVHMLTTLTLGKGCWEAIAFIWGIWTDHLHAVQIFN